MNVRTFTWRIPGINGLIQSNPHGMWKTPEEPKEEDKGLTKTKRKRGLRGTDSESFETAKAQLYVDDEGRYYHPCEMFWAGMMLACAGRKLGSLHALDAIVQAVTTVDENFLLYRLDTLNSKAPKLMKGDEWQIDYRRAVNHNKEKSEGGVAVVAIRPKWKHWGGFLKLEVDMELFTEEGVKEGVTGLLNIAGHQYGGGVGRRRIKAMVRMKPVWSGFGAGKYSAEFVG